MTDHTPKGGGGSGASFANWATGVLAIALAVLLVFWIIGAVFGSGLKVTYVPVTLPVVSGGGTVARAACTPEYTTSVGGTSYFRIPDGC